MKTYSIFLLEGEALQKISSAWQRKHPGMKLHAYDGNDGDIRLHSLEVPKEKRGQGIGSRALKGITKYADKNQKRVTLSQAPERGYKAKLDKFYKKNDFVPNKGRNKDFTTRDTMIRNPKKLKEQFIAERKESAPDAEKTITKNWERKHKGMTARIKNKGDSYHIGDVWLPPASRNKGVGNRFVKGVTKFAGKQGKDVTLRASAEKGQEDRLHKFYTKSGFKRQGNTNNYVKKPDPK